MWLNYTFLGGNFKFFRWGKITPSKKGSGAGKVTTPSFGVVLPFLFDIITLARRLILEVSKCIIPILHSFSCKYTILLRVKVHFKGLCKKNGKRGWQQFYTIFKCNFTLAFLILLPLQDVSFYKRKAV